MPLTFKKRDSGACFILNHRMVAKIRMSNYPMLLERNNLKLKILSDKDPIQFNKKEIVKGEDVKKLRVINSKKYFSMVFNLYKNSDLKS